MTYEIGSVIKERRKAKRITVDELSKATGLATSYIYQIESGKKTPPFDTIKLISNGLGVEISLIILESLKDDNISKKLLEIYEKNNYVN